MDAQRKEGDHGANWPLWEFRAIAPSLPETNASDDHVDATNLITATALIAVAVRTT